MDSKWPLVTPCWQLGHLGKGEAVLSTQDSGQDALFTYFALCGRASLLPPPQETGGLAGAPSGCGHHSLVTPGGHP